jgi:hypothetical protein
MITRPVRERPVDQVRTMVAAGLARTGYDEVSLTSLSTADLSDIESVVGGVLADREATPLGCPITVNLDWYVFRHRTVDEVLPWEHLGAGLHEDFLWADWQAALAGSGVEDCRWTPCYDCGVCTGYGIEHVVASTVPPAGGSQGTGQNLANVVPVGIR